MGDQCLVEGVGLLLYGLFELYAYDLGMMFFVEFLGEVFFVYLEVGFVLVFCGEVCEADEVCDHLCAFFG